MFIQKTSSSVDLTEQEVRILISGLGDAIFTVLLGLVHCIVGKSYK
jgi:hypothetical protein